MSSLSQWRKQNVNEALVAKKKIIPKSISIIQPKYKIMMPLALDGPAAKYATLVIDNLRFYLICVWIPVAWAQSSSSGDLIAWRAALIPLLLVTNHTIMEIVYGTFLLGPKTLAAVKRKQISKDFRSLRLLLDLTIMTCQLAAAVGALTHYGAFSPMNVRDSSKWEDWIRPLGMAYLEFIILILLKDATSMGYFHRKMHDPKNKFLCQMHQLHHSYTTNLNNINGSQIDPIDLFLENTIGPFLLVLLKSILSGQQGQISLVSFLCCISSEGSNHSLNPYSVSYYFPPLDILLKGNVAHNLHHARTNGNFLSHPWHHLWQGYQQDVDRYNQIMKTEVSFAAI